MTNFDEIINEFEKYQDLWIAVLGQAFVDLKSQSKKKMPKVNRVKSTIWLNMKEEFLKNCDIIKSDIHAHIRVNRQSEEFNRYQRKYYARKKLEKIYKLL